MYTDVSKSTDKVNLLQIKCVHYTRQNIFQRNSFDLCVCLLIIFIFNKRMKQKRRRVQRQMTLCSADSNTTNDDKQRMRERKDGSIVVLVYRIFKQESFNRNKKKKNRAHTDFCWMTNLYNNRDTNRQAEEFSPRTINDFRLKDKDFAFEKIPSILL